MTHDPEFDAILTEAETMLEDAEAAARYFVRQQDEALGWGGALLAEWLTRRKEHSDMLLRGMVAQLESAIAKDDAKRSQ